MNRRNEQIEAVSGWWNTERNKEKWDRAYIKTNVHGRMYLKTRQRRVLNYMNEAGLKEGSRVLELGYGAGQTALELGKRGFEVYGLDISEKFREVASARCRRMHPEGKFYLKTGNIESNYEFKDGFFDAVVVVGALQYLYDPSVCLREVFRVLRPGGFFVVAQRNIYSLSNLTSPREFARACAHFFLREKYELFPSFKSILVDSKLGCIFKRFEGSKFFNTRFMLKGHDEWKFKIKKRINSYFSLKSILKREGFATLKADGAYYCVSETPRFFYINLKADRLIEKINGKLRIPYLFTLGRSIVLLCKKGAREAFLQRSGGM